MRYRKYSIICNTQRIQRSSDILSPSIIWNLPNFNHPYSSPSFFLSNWNFSSEFLQALTFLTLNDLMHWAMMRDVHTPVQNSHATVIFGSMLYSNLHLERQCLKIVEIKLSQLFWGGS